MKTRLALLGCGDVAQRDYLPEMHRLADRAELVAVCGRTESRAREVAARYHIRTWYTDYSRMLAESDADAVVNLTPIQLHADTNLAALQSGRHVYTEKPAATSLSEAQRLREEAHRRGLTLVCAPSVLLFPQLRRARALLELGAIGEVHSARGHGHGGVPPWPDYPSDPSPYFAEGGGPAVDMGVYPLHALTGLLGPARRVTAFTARSHRSFVVDRGSRRGQEISVEVDDNWHLLLDFGDACLASVEASNCVHDTLAPQLELFGLGGTLALNLLDVSAPLQIFRPDSGWERVVLPQSGRESGPDHVLGLLHLLDCIQGRSRPALSIEHAIHVLEIIEKAHQASRSGHVQDLQTVLPWGG